MFPAFAQMLMSWRHFCVLVCRESMNPPMDNRSLLSEPAPQVFQPRVLFSHSCREMGPQMDSSQRRDSRSVHMLHHEDNSGTSKVSTLRGGGFRTLHCLALIGVALR